MYVTHFAKRSLLAATLGLALAACGKDAGPSEFNPQGASADMAAAEDAFASPQASSFAVVGSDISAALGGSPLVASSAALALTRPSAGSARYARQLAALVPAGGRGIQASMTAIPSGLLGTTFVWDVATETYVASDLGGAPAAGVRFQLYTVDPVQLRLVEPLVEVGHVDITDQSTATAANIRVKVVEGSVTYLDYAVTATATSSGGLVTIKGFTSNGAVFANFDLKNTLTPNTIVFDYDLTVPTRKLALNWSATFASVSSTEVSVTLDLGITGRNGNVRLAGTYGAVGGSLTFTVNGERFATVTIDGGTPVVTGATGVALTAEEEATLQTILDYYDASLTVFTNLVEPLS